MKRAIVIKRSAIVAAVGYLALLGAHFGWFDLTPAVQAQVVDVLAYTLPIVSPMLGAVWAHFGVTPVFDPQTSVSVPLVPAAPVVYAAPDDPSQEAIVVDDPNA